MKIKSSSDKFGTMFFVILFIPVTCIGIVLRLYQYLKLIESDTGFYSSKNALVWLFFILLVAFCVFCLVAAYFTDFSSNTRRKNSYKSLGVFSFVLTAAFFVNIFSCYSYISDKMNESDLAYHYSVTTQKMFLLSNGIVPARFEMLFSLLSSIAFLVLGIMILRNAADKYPRFLLIMPVFYGICKMVTLFVQRISFVQVSDLLLEIAFTAFLSVFFLSFAQCSSKLYSKIAFWRIVGVGLPAACLGLVLNVPKLLIMIFGQAEAYLNPTYPLNFVGLILPFFVLVCIFNLGFFADKKVKSVEG